MNMINFSEDAPPCPVCNSQNDQIPFQKYTEPVSQRIYTLFYCENCSVEYWTPLIMPLPEYYETQGGYYEEMHDDDNFDIRWWHKTFLKKFAKLNLRGKILDIGCADGRFLKIMKDMGWDIYGIEMDSISAEKAKKRCQTTNIFNGTLQEIQSSFPSHFFDVITFFEVFEHQTDPLVFFHSVKKLLKSKGIIAGSVPNRDRYIVNKRFSPDLPPHHFTLWNADALRRFIELQGFVDFKHYYTRYTPHLINQIARNVAYRFILDLKSMVGADSFHGTRNNESLSIKQIAIIYAKRYVWDNLICLLSILELPIVFLTNKSISFVFEATTVDNELE